MRSFYTKFVHHIAMMIAGGLSLLSTANTAAAQTSNAENLDCLRFVQIYERSMRIPQGLLTAISFMESGRQVNGGERTPWP